MILQVKSIRDGKNLNVGETDQIMTIYLYGSTGSNEYGQQLRTMHT